MFLSMGPVVERRGIILLVISMDLNPIYLYIARLIGSSFVSIPIILLFRQVIDYLRHRKYLKIVITCVVAKEKDELRSSKQLLFFVLLYL